VIILQLEQTAAKEREGVCGLRRQYLPVQTPGLLQPAGAVMCSCRVEAGVDRIGRRRVDAEFLRAQSGLIMP